MYGSVGGTLLIIFTQTIYAIIRAAVSVKLAQSVVGVRIPPHLQYEGYFEGLDHQVRNSLKESCFWGAGLKLGDHSGWWLLLTIESCIPVLIVMTGWRYGFPVWC